MKKFVFLLTIILCVSFALTVAANGDITVTIDSSPVTFDVPPQIINGRTMVPMRAIFEQLGATVTWDDATKTATGTTSDTTVSVTINSLLITINGELKAMDVAPQIVDGRTLVPARFISEAFGCHIEWDDATRTVSITTVPSDGKNSLFEYYTDAVFPFPTYDSVTSSELIDTYSDGTANVFMYEYTNDDSFLYYLSVLTDEGWQYDGSEYDDEFSSLTYHYTKNFHTIFISHEYGFNEVWVTYVLP